MGAAFAFTRATGLYVEHTTTPFPASTQLDTITMRLLNLPAKIFDQIIQAFVTKAGYLQLLTRAMSAVRSISRLRERN